MGLKRTTEEVILSQEERAKLELMVRRPKTDQRTALRAAIVLDCAQGWTNTAVATQWAVTLATVRKWRGRFLAHRLNGLCDAPRPGQPRRITDAKIEEVVTRTLEKTPAQRTHWSTRSMAKASGLTQNAIVRIWHAYGLKPHLAGELQAFERSVLCREGARHRGPVPQPARGHPCGRPVCG